MKLRNCIFIYIMVILFFSCNKNNDNRGQQETEKSNLFEKVTEFETKIYNGSKEYVALDDEMREAIRSKITATEEEKVAMKEFIYKNDEDIKKYNEKIVYIEKANFGMHGGDNWIIRLDSRTIYLYAISGNEIKKKNYIISFDLEENSDFNIMQDIPGTRIDNSTSSFGDFNGDGKNEIFEYGFYGYGAEIKIWGYDTEKDDFIDYCGIPFDIIDSYNGPAPVEFMVYNGKFGLKIYYFNIEVAGGPGWVPDPDPKNDTWIFYTWDKKQKKYVEIGELIE